MDILHDGVYTDNMNFNPIIQTSSLIGKEVKIMLISKQSFQNDLHVKIKLYGSICDLDWKQYDKNIFYTKTSYSDNITWKAMELFFGNNDFILVKPIHWVDTFYTNIQVEDTLVTQTQKNKELIFNILKDSTKFYKDILNTIINYIGV